MKSVLLFSFFVGGLHAKELVSSDRFIMKILDKTVSLQDHKYQLRNIKALQCVYPDALLIQYFRPSLIQDMTAFMKNFPAGAETVSRYLHEKKEVLEQSRHLFKIIRYAEDQKAQASPQLIKLIRESVQANNCSTEILQGRTLKTNFLKLLQAELYLKARYGSQLKGSSRTFNAIRPSIDLFVESLDKQFNHEYYW